MVNQIRSRKLRKANIVKKANKLKGLSLPKIDHAVKVYFKNIERAADFINYYLFHGDETISKDNLQIYDSDSSMVLDESPEIQTVGKVRDLLISSHHSTGPNFIGFEFQSHPDPSMPFRILNYDSITYMQQFSLTNNKSLIATPVSTLVFYLGESPWGYSNDSKDRMRISKEWEGINLTWTIRICDIKDIDIRKLRHPDNIAMVDAVQKLYKWDQRPETLEDIVLRKDIAIVVALIVGNVELKDIIERNEREEVDMCRSIREFKEKAERKAEMKGRVEGEKTGEKKKAVSLLVKLLKTKLKSLSPEVVVRIENSSLEALDRLSVKIFDINNEEDVLKILTC